jgi:hypothetical protein
MHQPFRPAICQRIRNHCAYANRCVLLGLTDTCALRKLACHACEGCSTSYPWNSSTIWGLGVAGLVLLVAFILVEQPLEERNACAYAIKCVRLSLSTSRDETEQLRERWRTGPVGSDRPAPRGVVDRSRPRRLRAGDPRDHPLPADGRRGACAPRASLGRPTRRPPARRETDHRGPGGFPGQTEPSWGRADWRRDGASCPLDRDAAVPIPATATLVTGPTGARPHLQKGIP